MEYLTLTKVLISLMKDSIFQVGCHGNGFPLHEVSVCIQGELHQNRN